MPIIILDDLYGPEDSSPERRAKVQMWYEAVYAGRDPAVFFGPMYPDHPFIRFLMMGDNTEIEGGKVDFRVSLKELARLRELLEEINETRAQLEAKLAETPEGLRIKLLKESAKATGQEKDALEVNIKAEAAKLWQPGQPKEVVRGVHVREKNKVIYDMASATAWCASHASAYTRLELNHDAFIKAVLVGALPGAPAEVENTVEIVLDRDLGDYLLSEEKPDVPRMVSVEDAGEGHDKT